MLLIIHIASYLPTLVCSGSLFCKKKWMQHTLIYFNVNLFCAFFTTYTFYLIWQWNIRLLWWYLPRTSSRHMWVWSHLQLTVGSFVLWKISLAVQARCREMLFLHIHATSVLCPVSSSSFSAGPCTEEERCGHTTLCGVRHKVVLFLSTNRLKPIPEASLSFFSVIKSCKENGD